MLKDKSELVNKRLILLTRTFASGHLGRPYVIAHVVTSYGGHVVWIPCECSCHATPDVA